MAWRYLDTSATSSDWSSGASASCPTTRASTSCASSERGGWLAPLATWRTSTAGFDGASAGRPGGGSRGAGAGGHAHPRGPQRLLLLGRVRRPQGGDAAAASRGPDRRIGRHPEAGSADGRLEPGRPAGPGLARRLRSTSGRRPAVLPGGGDRRSPDRSGQRVCPRPGDRGLGGGGAEAAAERPAREHRHRRRESRAAQPGGGPLGLAHGAGAPRADRRRAGAGPAGAACLAVVAQSASMGEHQVPGGGAVTLPEEELLAMYGGSPDEFQWYLALTYYKYASIFGYNLMLHRRGKRPDPIYEERTTTIVNFIAEGRRLLGAVREA